MMKTTPLEIYHEALQDILWICNPSSEAHRQLSKVARKMPQDDTRMLVNGRLKEIEAILDRRAARKLARARKALASTPPSPLFPHETTLFKSEVPKPKGGSLKLPRTPAKATAPEAPVKTPLKRPVPKNAVRVFSARKRPRG